MGKHREEAVTYERRTSSSWLHWQTQMEYSRRAADLLEDLVDVRPHPRHAAAVTVNRRTLESRAHRMGYDGDLVDLYAPPSHLDRCELCGGPADVTGHTGMVLCWDCAEPDRAWEVDR